MTRRAIITEGIIAVLAIVVAVAVHQRTEQWETALAVGLFAEILLQVFRFRAEYGAFLSRLSEGFEDREHPFEVLADLHQHTIPLALLTNRPPEQIFQNQFDHLIDELRKNLEALDGGHFVVPMEDVQDVSFQVCDSLNESAFCTAPQANLEIFMSRRGSELKEANFQAAARLKEKGQFTRLFIFDSMSSIKKEYFSLMEENHQSDVTVLVTLASTIEETLKKYYWDERADFGLWDNEYLITITNASSGTRLMEVSKDENLLRAARKVIAELAETAWSWEDFRREFAAPINEAHWSTTPEKLVRLESPNGPAPADCAAMCESALEVLQPHDRVAVYGLTNALIEQTGHVFDTRPDMQLSCDVVDCRVYRSDSLNDGFNYVKANWLEWTPRSEYRVVIGDDVIPNLGLWQVPLFFRSLYRAIAPGGRFITRSSAMYSPDTIHPTWIESLNKLRMFDPGNGTHVSGLDLEDLSEGAVYEVAWPALHGDGFYDEHCSCIDIGEWDKRLVFEQDTVDFKRKILLPYHYTVTSLDYGRLKELAAPFFQVVDEHPVHCVWDCEERLQANPGAKDIAERFHEYYRILVFERLAVGGRLEADEPLG
jgi:hypothetical protein